MFTSLKNSSVVKFFITISLIVSWSSFSSSPAGAEGEEAQPITTTTEAVQEEVLEEFVPVTNQDMFFSQDRDCPYSPEELEHEPITEAEIRGDSWESRIENCNTIADYDTYADCMFRPWVYGF